MELLALKGAITEKFKDYLADFTDNSPVAHLESAKLSEQWVAQLAYL